LESLSLEQFLERVKRKESISHWEFNLSFEWSVDALKALKVILANLYGANLYGANLDGANLDGANLVGANLVGANLVGALNVPAGLDYLKPVRDDLRAVLDKAPHEAAGLLAALWAGKIDGTKYEGSCACLVGTIANLRGVKYDGIVDLRPDSSRPSERWFLGISKGHTPLTNPSAAYAAAIIAQWQHDRANAKPKKKRLRVTKAVA
jgi:hypothetical protein